MAGVLCDDGIRALNELLAPAMVAAGYQVGLFVNNHTPAYSDILSTYSEPSMGGYARINLGTPISGGVAGNIDTVGFPTVTFTNTGTGLPETVYGYFITDGTVLIGAELFAVAIVVTSSSQGINVTPSLTYQDRSVP
jgi:hypothetical protein